MCCRYGFYHIQTRSQAHQGRCLEAASTQVASVVSYPELGPGRDDDLTFLRSLQDAGRGEDTHYTIFYGNLIHAVTAQRTVGIRPRRASRVMHFRGRDPVLISTRIARTLGWFSQTKVNGQGCPKLTINFILHSVYRVEERSRHLLGIHAT
jgi:hypothetical protein